MPMQHIFLHYALLKTISCTFESCAASGLWHWQWYWWWRWCCWWWWSPSAGCYTNTNNGKWTIKPWTHHCLYLHSIRFRSSFGRCHSHVFPIIHRNLFLICWFSPYFPLFFPDFLTAFANYSIVFIPVWFLFSWNNGLKILQTEFNNYWMGKFMEI